MYLLDTNILIRAKNDYYDFKVSFVEATRASHPAPMSSLWTSVSTSRRI